MSESTGKTKRAPAGRAKQLLRSWGFVALAALVLGAIFGGPAIAKYLKAPPISDGFGIEDAVVAMRLDADGTSYLVLVDPEGRTRSVQLEERGFERSRIAWSEAGLSTGGPADEYLLGPKGLTRFPLPSDLDRPTESARFVTRDGFAVQMSTQDGQRLAFVNAEAKKLTSVTPKYANPVLADCAGEIVAVSDAGVRIIGPESRDISGLGRFDGIEATTCDGTRIIGIGEMPNREHPAQTVRIWNRETGAQRTIEVRYPEAVSGPWPSTPFAIGGRLYWAVGGRLWSIPVDDAALGAGTAPVKAEAVTAAKLTDFLDDFDPVVGTDQGVLAASGDRLFGVAAQETYIEARKGPAFDRLDELAVFSVDPRTGERRIVLDVDELDFPRRDLHVHAIAVDPKWAAGR